MLKISKELDYAIQFIVALKKADIENPLALRTFAQNNTISYLFLQKIVRKLKKAGLIQSQKGSTGGYVLIKPFNDVSLLEVVEAIEGNYAAVACIDGTCPKEKNCTKKDVFVSLHTDLQKKLGSMYLHEYYV